MSKLQLPEVSLVMIDTRTHALARMAVEDCLKRADFGDVLIYSDNFNELRIPGAQHQRVEDWASKTEWCKWSWRVPTGDTVTSHMLYIQWDSWIVDPGMWSKRFLDFDYIGAPWWFHDGMNVGNGGFSLRTHRLMQHLVDHEDEFPVINDRDDYLLCRLYRPKLEQAGFKWADDDTALDFACELIRRSHTSRHFGFHDVVNWPMVLTPQELDERLAVAEKYGYIRDHGFLDRMNTNYPFIIEGRTADGHWQLATRDKGYLIEMEQHEEAFKGGKVAVKNVAQYKPEEAPGTVRTRECKHGTFCFLPHDVYIGRALDWYGEYSEGEVEVFQHLLKPGMIVIEVGANIGTHTIPMARFVGPEGRVYAFEPQRVVHQMLCANAAMNGLFNVFAENKACGNPLAKDATICVPELDYTQTNNYGGVVLGYPSNVSVPLIRLDAYENVFPNFIKIDVEGMELEVLSGALDMIKRSRPVIYCENHDKDKSPALIKQLQDLGYDMWWHLVPLYNFSNWRGNKDQAIYLDSEGHALVSCNMLCAPQALKFEVVGLRKVSDPQDYWRPEEYGGSPPGEKFPELAEAVL